MPPTSKTSPAGGIGEFAPNVSFQPRYVSPVNPEVRPSPLVQLGQALLQSVDTAANVVNAVNRDRYLDKEREKEKAWEARRRAQEDEQANRERWANDEAEQIRAASLIPDQAEARAELVNYYERAADVMEDGPVRRSFLTNAAEHRGWIAANAQRREEALREQQISAAKEVTRIAGTFVKDSLISVTGADYGKLRDVNDPLAQRSIIRDELTFYATAGGAAVDEDGAPVDPYLVDEINRESDRLFWELRQNRFEAEGKDIVSRAKLSAANIANSRDSLTAKYGSLYTATKHLDPSTQAEILEPAFRKAVEGLKNGVASGRVKYPEAQQQLEEFAQFSESLAYEGPMVAVVDEIKSTVVQARKEATDTFKVSVSAALKKAVPGKSRKAWQLVQQPNDAVPPAIDTLLLEVAKESGIEIPDGAVSIRDLPVESPAEVELIGALDDVREAIYEEARDDGWRPESKADVTPFSLLSMIKAGATRNNADSNAAFSVTPGLALLEGRLDEVPGGIEAITDTVNRNGEIVSESDVEEILGGGGDPAKRDLFYRGAGRTAAEPFTGSHANLPSDLAGSLYDTIMTGQDNDRLQWAIGAIQQLGGPGSERVRNIVRTRGNEQERRDFLKLVHTLVDPTSAAATVSVPNADPMAAFLEARTNYLNPPDDKISGESVNKIIYGDTDSKRGPAEAIRTALDLGDDVQIRVSNDDLANLERAAIGLSDQRSFKDWKDLWRTVVETDASSGYRYAVETQDSGTKVLRRLYDTHGHVVERLNDQDPDIRVNQYAKNMMRMIPPGALKTQMREYFGIPDDVSSDGWDTWAYIQYAYPEEFGKRSLDSVRFRVNYTRYPGLLGKDSTLMAGGGGDGDISHRDYLGMDTTWLAGGGVLMVDDINPQGTLKGLIITGKGAEADRGPFTVSNKSLQQIPYVTSGIPRSRPSRTQSARRPYDPEKGRVMTISEMRAAGLLGRPAPQPSAPQPQQTPQPTGTPKASKPLGEPGSVLGWLSGDAPPSPVNVPMNSSPTSIDSTLATLR